MKQRTKQKIAKLKKEKRRKMIQEAYSGNLSKAEIAQRRDALAYRLVTLFRQAEPLKQQLDHIQQASHETQKELQAYEAAFANAERVEADRSATEDGDSPPPPAVESEQPVVAASKPETNVVPMKSRRRKGH